MTLLCGQISRGIIENSCRVGLGRGACDQVNEVGHASRFSTENTRFRMKNSDAAAKMLQTESILFELRRYMHLNLTYDWRYAHERF